MRRTITALLAATILTLTGCSSSDSDKPSKPTPSATPSTPSKQSAADAITACTEAIAAGKSQDGPECTGLSPDDLFKAVQAANKRGRDSLQSAIASASAAAR